MYNQGGRDLYSSCTDRAGGTYAVVAQTVREGLIQQLYRQDGRDLYSSCTDRAGGTYTVVVQTGRAGLIQ